MKALIVVDVQNDFVEGGALAVTGGRGVVPRINQLIDEIGKNGFIVFTQDWHPLNHSQFVTQGGQWPVHCVQNTEGAKLVADLKRHEGANVAVVHKGADRLQDGYSGFEGVDGAGKSLQELLRAHAVDEVVVCGIATDYCVRATALDAQKAGFKVELAGDATVGVSSQTTEKALAEMKNAGVSVE